MASTARKKMNRFIRPLRTRIPQLQAIFARAATKEQASEEILAFATSAEIAELVAQVMRETEVSSQKKL